ncbi:unnamed protein product [Chilo suppressalis]|uniref:Protein kinase domain-containing protein n=1 Tax=Chilo suppressalis TaxID=168631 RepID=A0ABN8L6A9_CHISP|nr:unnamed protein product [Chilo suppressalis]
MRSICALWAIITALALVKCAGADPFASAVDDGEDFSVAVYGVAPDTSKTSGAALAGVAALVLRTAGLHAEPQNPPGICTGPNVDPDKCVAASLAALSIGHAHAALLPVRATAVPSAPRLRDSGLEELGDAAPPWRRTCLATAPPARSLLDFADSRIASVYRLTPHDLSYNGYQCKSKNCTFVPNWCTSDNSTCATVLTSDESEKNVLANLVLDNKLYASVTFLGPRFMKIVEILSDRPFVVCDKTLQLSSFNDKRKVLGPPPCQGTDPCPFEANRLIKIANVRALARYPSALRSLVRLSFTAEELSNLTSLAVNGPEEAARLFVAAHPSATWPGEARVAVLLPASTMREAYEARSFESAAELVERELEHERQPRAARFKVEVFDDACSAPRAYKYLTDALGTGEYGALSALAGPACGAAFADVARQSPAHALPVLAYTPQTPPPPPATALALLAAGDARQYSELWAAVLARMHWRRLAILSETATHSSLDVAKLQSYDVNHFELVDDGTGIHKDLIAQWAKRAASSNLRIVYACLEDAREVRAALSAGHAAGLTPTAGAVWILPGTLPDGWLQPDRADSDDCGPSLSAMAEGHLRAIPAWLAGWSEAKRTEWEKRCPGCKADAALLYDALRLWAGALRRLLAAKPTSLDDLHRPDLVRTLIDDLTSTVYTGLTGPFKWNSSDGVHARFTPLVIQQWRNGTYFDVGSWDGSNLSLDVTKLRWLTSDGREPDDGSEHCGLQPLADLLGGDCRAAFIALAALLLAMLVAALAALAVYCRRRAEREYRAHLEALRLRTYGLKPGGLDRWELPRERVVINRKLGTGAFGTVYGGHALLAEDRGWTAVAVKTLKAGASTEEKLDFLSEAEAMKRFDHKNVVRLLGVVTKTEPVCTVMEFMLYGDLKNYLLARRHLAVESGFGMEADETSEEVSPRRLTSMALDVARALSYLAQLRYVHRDVAARNCLVSAHRVVKLADFGMTRLVFENDYYRFSRKGMLPVRWMAPESLALGVFSPASDVWSFGVLLYEIVTFGSLPFQGLSNSEVLTRVKAGHTLELPTGLKPQLEGLIKSCWRQDYKTRPAASEVTAFLADSPRLLAPCLDVPLDAMPLDADPPWRAARDRAEARWVSWAAPPSAATDTTYLSTEGQAPQEGDAFLP